MRWVVDSFLSFFERGTGFLRVRVFFRLILWWLLFGVDEVCTEDHGGHSRDGFIGLVLIERGLEVFVVFFLFILELVNNLHGPSFTSTMN